MDVAAPYVVASVVMVQCSIFFFGMFRGRGDRAALREGAASLAFAAHAAAHAATVMLGRSAEPWTLVVEAAATVALVPAWVALGANVDPTLHRRLRDATRYAVAGVALLVVGALAGETLGLSEPLSRGASTTPTRAEVAVVAYVGVGLLACVATTFVLTRAFLAGRSAKEHAGAVVAAMVGTVVVAVPELAWVAASGRRPLGLLDVGLLVVTLTVLDATIGRLRSLGDELQKKTSALTQSHAELHSTQARIVRNEQLAAVGELSAVIAHEVRNPLAIIKNALSGLRRKTITPESRATLLDILEEETDKLNRLMHDLLAYARPVAPRLSHVDVDALLHRAVERAFGGVSHPRGLEVVFDVRFVPELFDADFELLVHALVNVIENGLQAMPEGGTLTLSTSRETLGGRDAIAMTVADTGEGMDPQIREKARNPFFTTRPTGTGLGLAIVERVIRNHGGVIAFDSAPRVGTSVTITLPLDRHSLTPLPPPEAALGGLVAAMERRS